MREGKKVGKRSKKKAKKSEGTQGNPILEIEKEVQDPKYEKYRQKHLETVTPKLC
jgi:hypothetical protein